MTTLTIALLALAAFAAGLYLGHRWGSHDARIEADDQRLRCRRILRFAAPYIDAHAEAHGWLVDRNPDGVITDLHEPPIRCGTHALMMQQLRATSRDKAPPR